MSIIRSITIDCRDPYELAQFWSKVLEAPIGEDDFPGDPEAMVDLGEAEPRLLFERVPEGKAVKNRVHLDIRPPRPREEEIERLVGLGATFIEDHREDGGAGWVVLADPEGNEFCVERSIAQAG